MKVVHAILAAGVVGCAFVQPVWAQTVSTFQEKVLYSFCTKHKCTDGKHPTSIIDVNGALYGITTGGGHTGCYPFGCGTVFSVDPNAGTEKVLYHFCSRRRCADGETPSALLIDANGIMYGTTWNGGTSFYHRKGYGTAFVFDPNTNAEKVLYSFCSQYNCTDGANATSLIDIRGVLYGTSQGGGTGFDGSSYGTAFALDPKTGSERVLYSFCSQQNCLDGQNPNPALIEVNGLLYGVTIAGGAYSCGNGSGCGTVFSVSPKSGAETILHSFGNGSDGKGPESSLIAVDGLLYGTTYGGGITGCTTFGCGTVFSVDPNTGAETVLYSFCSQANCKDGATPLAGLSVANGTLYGATYAGGGTGCGGAGCGTVFSIDPNTGAETVLYSFQGSADGANPESNLLDVGGTLYGTTIGGGGRSCGGLGCGTVFVLSTKR